MSKRRVPTIRFVGTARSFGKSTLYGVGMTFLPFIFIPLLGLGADQYHGPRD